jgi:hypothetical protein
VGLEARESNSSAMAISLKIPLVLVDDGDLVRVSRENPGYRFEREEDARSTRSAQAAWPSIRAQATRSGNAAP